MQEQFTFTPPLLIALHGVASGTFLPALHGEPPQWQANNALLEWCSHDADRPMREPGNEGYLLQAYQFLQVTPEVKTQGVRIELDAEGEPVCAHVLRNDWFYPAELELFRKELWAPETGVVSFIFELSFKIGRRTHLLVDGRVDLTSSYLLDADPHES